MTGILLSLLAGIALGAFFAHGLWVAPAKQRFEDQYVRSATDQAFIGLLVSQGQSRYLRKILGDALPEYAAAIAEHHRASPLAVDALYVIRRYYERNGLPIPDEIRPILLDLEGGPSPDCKQKLEEIERSASAHPSQFEP